MMNVSASGTSGLWKVMNVSAFCTSDQLWGALKALWAFIGYVGAMLGLCWGMLGLCWGERETGETGYRGERRNNEHECWEKTVTEGMAMQADHKQYSYREITKTSSHSSTFKSNYSHSGAMLEFVFAMLDHSPGVSLIIFRSRQ